MNVGGHFSKLVFVLCVALCSTGTVRAQDHTAANKERFDRITTADGLSQGTVYAFCQDRHGFLWFGTQDGLNRWDGHAMKVWKHDPDDQRTISQGYIRALLVGDDDVLWVGTDGGGLGRLDPRTGAVKRFGLPVDTLRSKTSSVFCLAQDAQGRILVGGPLGLFAFHPQRAVFERIDVEASLPVRSNDLFVYAMLVDRDQRIWLGTKTGLFRISADGRSTACFRHDPNDPQSLPSNDVKALCQDRNGSIWAGTYGQGLCRLDSAANGRIDQAWPALGFVYGIAEDRFGKLWVATFNGVHVLDADRQRITAYHKDVNDPRALPSDLILSIQSDRSGLIWVSTSGKGVCYTDPAPDRFHVIDDRMGQGARLSESFVYGVSEDAQGRIMIATAGGGLNVWDRRTNSMFTMRHDPLARTGLNSDVSRCVLQDRKGRIWVGSDKSGLDRRNSDGGDHRTYVRDTNHPRSIGSNVILTLYEDAAGTIWVGTYNTGLARYNEATDDFTNYSHDPNDATSIAGNIVRCIIEDAEGGLWIGTGGAGLCLMDRERGTFTSIRKAPGDPRSLSNDFIRSMHRGSDGALWVGTNGGGLNRLQRTREGRFSARAFTTHQGFADNVVYGILEGPLGTLWVSTNKGLSAFDLRRAVDHTTTDAEGNRSDAYRTASLFANYTAYHGVQEGEFNGGAYYRDRAGWLYFGGVHGITYFHPDSMDRTETSRMVTITELQVRNRPVLIDTTASRQPNHLRAAGEHYLLDRLPHLIDSLVIPHAASMFSFTFASMDFNRPDDADYFYILEGLDAEWNSIGNRRFISFTNLDPGAYVLKIAAGRNGFRPEGPFKVVHIIIDPPFWMTLWFRAAIALAAALMLLALVRQRYRKVERENQRMQALVAERTRELSEQTALVEQRNAELEQLNDLNRRILSVISHDFKGPLISMRLLIDMLRSGRYERLDLHTSDIRNQLVQSEMVLQNLLDWARLELGTEQAVQPGRPRGAGDVVQEIVAELDPLIREKGLTVLQRIDPPAAQPVPVDVLRIIYRNLIGNALKYSPAGGTVTCGYDPATQEYSVCDEGHGMAPELVGRLFKGSVHSTLGTHHEKGFGLGLYLTAELVEKNGGSIRVETGSDGSSFYFRFPSRH